MELHAVNREPPMANAHDDAVLLGARGDLELGGKSIFRNDKRVIPRGHERPIESMEDSTAVVLDRRRLAVHRHRRAHDRAAEHRADGLVSEAYAEDRDSLAKLLDRRHRQT